MAVDAGTALAKFRTWYVSNEHNIDRQYLDHRTGSPYNQFSYDNLDRLSGVTYFDAKVDGFAMDDLGNRIGNQTQRDILHNYYMDPLTNDPITNRYSTIDAAPIAHDPAGNLTRDRQNYRYEYDYENRIARIYKLSGETQVTVATFDYDALGHRVRKIDAVAGTTTLYYNDPEWRVLAEYAPTNNQLRKFIYGNYIDEALALIDTYASDGSPVGTYYFLHDHLYSPAVLIGLESGQWRPVERYEYDAYGTARVINRGLDNAWFTADDVVTGSSAINTTLFTGRTLDTFDSANLKIMYYRHRYTDPFTGRFLQQDPMEYEDGLNLYQYANHDPLMGLDAYGLSENGFGWSSNGDPYGHLTYSYSVMRQKNEEPELAYKKDVIDRSKDYKSYPNPDPQEIKHIRIRANNTYWNMLHPYPLSAFLLKTYMQNNQPCGSEIIGNFDVGTLMHVRNIGFSGILRRYRIARNEANEHVWSAVNMIQENSWLWSGMSIRTSHSILHNYGLTGDLGYAIAGHHLWHKVENIRCQDGYLSGDMTLFLWDVYDFDEGWKDLGAPLANSEVTGGDLEFMHKAGAYRAFFVYGKATKHLRWRYPEIPWTIDW